MAIVPDGVPTFMPKRGNAGTKRRERNGCEDSFSLQENISGFGSLDLFLDCQLVKRLNKPLVADSKAGAKVRNCKRPGRIRKKFKDASGQGAVASGTGCGIGRVRRISRNKGEIWVAAIRMHKIQSYRTERRRRTMLRSEHEPALTALQMQKGVRPGIKIRGPA
jgi:hypothetical protein